MCIKVIIVSIAAAYLLYRSIAGVMVILPFIPWYIRIDRLNRRDRRRNRLNQQFKDALISISEALSSGYSIENSILEAAKDMELMYGKKADITLELIGVVRKLQINVNVEDAIKDLACRSGIEDIETFSEIFSIAKRGGGNLIEIISKIRDSIGDKIDVRREIEVIICSKRYEQMIMRAMPVFIMGYIEITSPGFLNPLYETILGRIIMTICFIIYIFAISISNRICRISLM